MANLKRALKEKLARRDLVTCIFPVHSSAGLTYFLAGLGFDFIIIDTEQGGPGIETVAEMIRAAHACDVAAVVRPWSKDAGLLRRYLDYGIDGVIVPETETPADIEHVLREIENTSAPDWEDTVLIALIESAAAIDNLERILALKDVDGVFVGPGDLARSMGLPRYGNNPSVREKVLKVCELARTAGKSVGTPPFNDGFDACIRAGSNLMPFSLNQIMKQSVSDTLAALKTSFL